MKKDNTTAKPKSRKKGPSNLSIKQMHYENLEMVIRTKSNFYVKNFSFLIIFLSKSLYKGHKFNEKYRKNLNFRGPTPRLIPGLTSRIKNPAIFNFLIVFLLHKKDVHSKM
jgi:hypothetical protein